jgi:hypothetical protein
MKLRDAICIVFGINILVEDKSLVIARERIEGWMRAGAGRRARSSANVAATGDLESWRGKKRGKRGGKKRGDVIGCKVYLAASLVTGGFAQAQKENRSALLGVEPKQRTPLLPT